MDDDGKRARILVMSDLHNEFERPAPRRPTSAWEDLAAARSSAQGHPDIGPWLGDFVGERIDLVVMAGDIDLDEAGIAYADRVSLYLGAPVVYIMGNHEAYNGRDLDMLVPELRAAAKATAGRVSFLENNTLALDTPGGRLWVLGCTLWTDYAVNGGEADVTWAMRDAANGLNDHLRIYLRGSRLSPFAARGLHECSRKWLGREVARIREAEGDDARIVIATHHAPVPQANPPQYFGGKLSPAFSSDLRAEIDAWRPVLWVWGHTHYSMDEHQGDTRLLSSQRGYVCAEFGADTYRPALIKV